MDPRSLEARLRRQAPDALPGPDPALGARIQAAVRREARAGRPRRRDPDAAVERRRSLLAPLGLAAAAVLLWFGWPLRPQEPAGERAAVRPTREWGSPELARLERLVARPSDELRAWVDEPLLREVRHWVEAGARAVRTYSELVPAPMLERAEAGGEG